MIETIFSLAQTTFYTVLFTGIAYIAGVLVTEDTHPVVAIPFGIFAVAMAGVLLLIVLVGILFGMDGDEQDD